MKIRRNGRFAFTLTELLVAIGIVATLAAILVPVFFNVRENGRQTVCLSNIRQLAAAVTLYAQDADGYFPTQNVTTIADVADWDSQILPYVKDRGVFRCPDCQVPRAIDANPRVISKGYAINADISGAFDGSRPRSIDTGVRFPANTITLSEVSYKIETKGPDAGNPVTTTQTDSADDGSDIASGVTCFGLPGAKRHRSGSNYGFADGHSRWYRPEQVTDGRAQNDAGLPNASTGPSFAL